MYHAAIEMPAAAVRPANAGSRCDACLARVSAICAVLDAQEMACFARLGRIDRPRRSETYFWEGQAAGSIATVRSGMLKLTASLADGREQIVGLALPGDVIGRPFADKVEYCATALDDAELCIIRRDDFEGFIDTHPAMMRALLARVLADLDRTRSRILLLGRKTARERVASLLLELAAAEDATDNGRTFPMPIRRQAMADLLGLTIETVSRQIMMLVEIGVIEAPTSKSMRIADKNRLKREAGEL